jgi:hypothetical protein
MISSRKRMPNRTHRNPKLNSIVSDNLDFRFLWHGNSFHLKANHN